MSEEFDWFIKQGRQTGTPRSIYISPIQGLIPSHKLSNFHENLPLKPSTPRHIVRINKRTMVKSEGMAAQDDAAEIPINM